MFARQLREAALRRVSAGPLAEALGLLCVIGLIASLARVGSGMFVPFEPPNTPLPQIDLDPVNLPYYLARSTIRMFIALGLSVLFTLVYGYVAANSKRAERVLIPVLDVLQSVPVLGFLSVTVTGFIALFRGSLLGLECAAIFAIFTGQAWNMTFAFYQSLRTMPKELHEACRLYQLNRWQRFRRLEVPFAMIPLVWNAMMSFGGGWFFVAASEAITVLNKRYTLPGVGSYVTKAIEEQNTSALLYAVVGMALMIVLVDQLFWKPIVAWSDRFKLDQNAGGEEPASWVLDLIRGSKVGAWLVAVWTKNARKLRPRRRRGFKPLVGFEEGVRKPSRWGDLAFYGLIGAIIGMLGYAGVRFVLTEVGASEITLAFVYGLLTLLRVVALVAASSLVWVPVGVAIGFHPRFARFAQPLAQFLASFPANFLFPFFTALLIRFHVSLDIGGILLMSLGAQWYVLFNVIAGAQAIPSDLKEMAKVFQLQGWPLWKSLILPGIFPFYVSGAVTAAGGAWNASIVAETVSWGDQTLVAHGLGAYVSGATQAGDWPRIVLGVGMMSVIVVSVNRLVWRKLYAYAAQKCTL